MNYIFVVLHPTYFFGNILLENTQPMLPFLSWFCKDIFSACSQKATYCINSPYQIKDKLIPMHWICSFNTLRPGQNGRHFADDIFKRIFFKENIWILIKISLKFVPKGPINKIPALFQIMAWCRSGDKPLSETMMVSLPTHICVTRPQWVNHHGYPCFCSAKRELKQDRANSRFSPSQWETALLCNDVSHWLGASIESALLDMHIVILIFISCIIYYACRLMFVSRFCLDCYFTCTKNIDSHAQHVYK